MSKLGSSEVRRAPGLAASWQRGQGPSNGTLLTTMGHVDFILIAVRRSVWRPFSRRGQISFQLQKQRFGGVLGMNSRGPGWRQRGQLGGCFNNAGPGGRELEP